MTGLVHKHSKNTDTETTSALRGLVRYGRLRRVLAWIISRLPLNCLRVLLYRHVHGYSLVRTVIGLGTVIDVESLVAHGARIGRSCEFLGPIRVILDEGTGIGNGNRFLCGVWTLDYVLYRRELRIGRGVQITSGHYFDVDGAIIIGDGTWIAGYGSQFWTHGPTTGKIDIHIGQDCYIGSAVRFVPGAAVGDRVLVGVGSVVCNAIEGDDTLVAGVPASIRKEHYLWRVKACFGGTGVASRTDPDGTGEGNQEMGNHLPVREHR